MKGSVPIVIHIWLLEITNKYFMMIFIKTTEPVVTHGGNIPSATESICYNIDRFILIIRKREAQLLYYYKKIE
jgi:hypothetical protein